MQTSIIGTIGEYLRIIGEYLRIIGEYLRIIGEYYVKLYILVQ